MFVPQFSAFDGAAKRMASVHLYWDFIYRLTNHHRQLKKARKVVCDFFNKVQAALF